MKEIVKSDYNISPTRYVFQDSGKEVLPLKDVVVLLQKAEEERTKADKVLNNVLNSQSYESF